MKRIIGLLSLILLSSTSFAQQPVLLKDIPGDNHISYRNLRAVNGLLFFTAEDAAHGDELWKSDGTATGTVMVKDIFPGPENSAIDNLTPINGILYFTAYNGVHGTEVWKSDGTAAGTQMLKDINPSDTRSDFNADFAELNGKVYFQANDGDDAHGSELWTTDGTTAGTVMVKDIAPGIYAGSYPLYLTKAGNYLYFIATDVAHGRELWRTDGTEAGTQLVKDIKPGTLSSIPKTFTAFNGNLYLYADNGINGRELWKSDGTEAGTQMLKDINPGFVDPNAFVELVVFNGSLYFNASDGVNGYKLWKSNGTEAGTQMVGITALAGSNFTEANGQLFYHSGTAATNSELWKTDGTEAGTGMVKDINPGTGRGNPHGIVELNGILYFSADDGQHGYELWKSDGTEAGTTLVLDIVPGSNSSVPLALTTVQGRLYFITASDGNFGNDQDLWMIGSLAAEVTGFTLINAVSDQDILLLQDNEIINLAALTTNKLNIRGNVLSPAIRSVVFKLNGAVFRVESGAPFALAGDNSGNYHPWTPAPGHYELCATPYSGLNGTGTVGISACLKFTVVNVSFGITHFTLVNTYNNSDIINFFDEDNGDDEDIVTFDLSGLPHPEFINIRSNTYPPTVGTVSFGFDNGDYSSVQAYPQYMLFGGGPGNWVKWQNALPKTMGGSCETEAYHRCTVDVRKNAQLYSTSFRFRLKYDDIRVTNFALVNAITDEPMYDLEDGTFIDLADLPTNKLNIWVGTQPEIVGGLVINGKSESIAPYSVYGDNNGNFNAWTPTPGIYVIEATPYNLPQKAPFDASKAKGVCGIPKTITFTIFDSGQRGVNKTGAETNAGASGFSALQVFPNPNEGVFNVTFTVKETADVKVEVYDLLGKMVYQDELLSFSGAYFRQLDLSVYGQGIYMLKVQEGARTPMVKKITIDGR